MHQAKYIIIQYGSTELPIIFPSLLNHSDVAANMGGNVVSAGFVTFGTTTDDDGLCPEVVCQAYGRGVTLDKKARKDDYKIIQDHLQLS